MLFLPSPSNHAKAIVMSHQIPYYDQFGNAHRNEILSSQEPHLWTTDQKVNGPIFREMSKRVSLQKKFVQKYFNKQFIVLDIGCGFGRQAFLLAMMGFCVLGIDTSPAFVEIAEELFQVNHFFGTFLCTDIMRTRLGNRYKNVLLLDVLEHVMPHKRKRFIKRVFRLTKPGCHVLVSLPHVSESQNNIKKKIKQYFTFFTKREEHPYIIPQKSDVERLTKDYFTIVEFEETPETDYYVLRRN
jgi:2-polyprenyl-3-methyl-5-hydroxy-6-metoxy-1,4-benzoquinol methylase